MSWASDAAPLFSVKCLSCHEVPGAESLNKSFSVSELVVDGFVFEGLSLPCSTGVTSSSPTSTNSRGTELRSAFVASLMSSLEHIKAVREIPSGHRNPGFVSLDAKCMPCHVCDQDVVHE